MPELATVVSVRGRDRDALLADPAFVYVGRPVFRGSHRWKGSDWANPFRVGMKRSQAARLIGYEVGGEDDQIAPLIKPDTVDSPRLAVHLFQHWLDDQPELMARLPELAGKRLGCWCGDWSPGGELGSALWCHARILAQRVNRIVEEGVARG